MKKSTKTRIVSAVVVFVIYMAVYMAGIRLGAIPLVLLFLLGDWIGKQIFKDED